jgi:peptidoglycan/LPS O-acetylase OafA/YrhL
LLIAAALLAAVISYLRRYVKLIPNYNISLLLDFAVCFAVGLLTAFLFVSATMKVNFSTPMWLYLGKNSYEIYLVHGFCIIILERIVYFQNASQDLLFGLAVLAFTLVLAPMLNYADKGLLKIFKVK